MIIFVVLVLTFSSLGSLARGDEASLGQVSVVTCAQCKFPSRDHSLNVSHALHSHLKAYTLNDRSYGYIFPTIEIIVGTAPYVKCPINTLLFIELGVHS